MDNQKYPFGPFALKKDFPMELVFQFLETMAQAPIHYRQLVEQLSEEDLNKTYRPGSWTVRQLVHHVTDIQLLNFLRIKKALTEENYEATLVKMDAWAATPDANMAPVEDSLIMLDGITRRFVYLIKELDEESLSRTFYHPLRQFHLTLKQGLQMSVWHLEHHQGHIEQALGLPLHSFELM